MSHVERIFDPTWKLCLAPAREVRFCVRAYVRREPGTFSFLARLMRGDRLAGGGLEVGTRRTLKRLAALG